MEASDSTATAPVTPATTEEPVVPAPSTGNTGNASVLKSDEDKMEVENKSGEKIKGEDKMDVESKPEEKVNKKEADSSGGKGGTETAAPSGGGGGDKKKTEEPDFQMIANPARVLPQQVNCMLYMCSNRFVIVYL